MMEVQTEKEFEKFKELRERLTGATEKLSEIILTRPTSKEHKELVKEWQQAYDELEDFLQKYVGEF